MVLSNLTERFSARQLFCLAFAAAGAVEVLSYVNIWITGRDPDGPFNLHVSSIRQVLQYLIVLPIGLTFVGQSIVLGFFVWLFRKFFKVRSYIFPILLASATVSMVTSGYLAGIILTTLMMIVVNWFYLSLDDRDESPFFYTTVLWSFLGILILILEYINRVAF